MFSFEGTKEANNVLEFVGKIPCDCKHRLKKPVSGSEIVGSAGIDEEARTCMKIKREETGERKGGGSLGPVSEVGEKGKKRGQIGKISASESPPQTTSRLVSLARFVFFAHADFFSPFSPNAEFGSRLGRRSLLSLLSTACSGIPAPGKPSDWSDLTGYIDTFQLWVVSVTQKNRGIHDNFCSTNVFMKFPHIRTLRKEQKSCLVNVARVEKMFLQSGILPTAFGKSLIFQLYPRLKRLTSWSNHE